MHLEQALLAQYHQYRPQLHARALYLACSGGRDSLALAWACLSLYQQGKLDNLPILLHVNHHWQASNDSWAAAHVANFAHRYGFACQVLDITPPTNENTARQARYQAMFERMANQGVLLLAHHSDDQAETMLMRLINGTGLTGLTAMQPWQDRVYQHKTLALFRPWLYQSRQAISQYAHHYKLDYIDDPTNTHGDNARSLMRRTLMPALTALNPQAIANIARTSRLLDDARQLVDGVISEQLIALTKLPTMPTVSLGDRRQILDVHGLLTQTQPVQRAVMAAFVKGACDYGASFALIERLLALCQRADGDHQTQHYWQSRPNTTNPNATAYVFCRYGQSLYRYRADFWTKLVSPMADTWQIVDNQAMLKLDEGVLCLVGVAFYQFTKMDKHSKVLVHHRFLSGKKLYQTLKIAPWYRHHLWLVDYDCDGRRATCLVALGQVWSLGDDPCLPRLMFISE